MSKRVNKTAVTKKVAAPAVSEPAPAPAQVTLASAAVPAVVSVQAPVTAPVVAPVAAPAVTPAVAPASTQDQDGKQSVTINKKKAPRVRAKPREFTDLQTELVEQLQIAHDALKIALRNGKSIMAAHN